MTTQSDTRSLRKIRSVVHVCREYAGIAGAGGMKDVTAGLALASAERGIDTHVILPYYRAIAGKEGIRPEPILRFPVPMNYTFETRSEVATIHRIRLRDNLHVYLVASGRYEYLFEGHGIERHGIYQYTRAEAAALDRPELKGQGYIDFFAMNVLLVKSALFMMGELELKPNAIHCHDGHAALLPLIAQASDEGFAPFLAHVPCVLTIHNAGRDYHQDVTDLDFASRICGITRSVVDGCRLDGRFDPLFAGSLCAHRVNTVSENYAHELVHTAQDALTRWLGHSLVSRGIDLKGITNGVAAASHDPVNGRKLGLAADFSPRDHDLAGKEACKKATLEALVRGEAPAGIMLHGTVSVAKETPLLTFVSRLEAQKGMDILAVALDELFLQDQKVQLLGLGDGERSIEDLFSALADKFRGRICIASGFNESFARQVYAAGDFLLIPSRYEPCGLTDFYAQLMGNVPVVHGVGGLVKTLDDRFGFSYLGGKKELLEALNRGLAAFRTKGKPELRRIQKAAVENIYAHFTWEKVLDKYLRLYREAIARTEPVLPY